jgi:DNA-binding CsgD family transcriptional regulator
MELYEWLLELFRMKRPPGLRYFELDEELHTALVDRADRESRPAEDIQREFVAAGLAQLQTSDELKARWETLSKRERDVTSLTCLKYTNRQMAAMMKVSPDTVKGYIRQALVKFNVHSKDELRILLELWDFSDWGPRAQG